MPEVSDPERRALALERLLQALIVYMSRAEPSFADYPRERFVNRPGPVQVSFNEDNQAQQEKERLINEARRE